MTSDSRHRRRFGQNFLVDGGAVARIIAALQVRDGDAVLEIGPGRGALTGDLIDAAGRIAAIEVDAALADRLSARYGPDRLLLVSRDVLQVDLAEIAHRLGVDASTGLAIAGNLPYNISKPIAMKLIEQRSVVQRAVLMFQREVAQRLVARPATRDYGPLTVLAGLTFSIERLFDLGPSAFRPRPKVSSTVTVWRRREGSPLDQIDKPLKQCLRAAFGRRRQTLRNNLRAALGSSSRAEELLETARLDGALRAEAIPAEGFVRLAQAWKI